MDLILDIGNFRIKGALFDGDEISQFFVVAPDVKELEQGLAHHPIDRCPISSVNQPALEKVQQVLNLMEISYQMLDLSNLTITLDVDEPEAVGQDRIANVYGALFRFPQNDCIVVDLGTAVTFDYAAANGTYAGGAIFPGVDIGAKALADYTDKLPEVSMDIPETPIAKTTRAHIQSGLYWGLLGAVERITFEMRSTCPNPSDVKVIATGGLLYRLGEEFTQDLSDIVDLIDPALTLIGIHEIMKEKKYG